MDLYAPLGTTLYACVDGEIYDPYYSNSYGNTVSIKGKYNGKTYYFFYAHMNAATTFKAGDKIKAGDIIGYSGKTGTSASGLKTNQVHLHFELRTEGTRVGNRIDPFIIPELNNGVVKKPKKEDQGWKD
ncbi:M23 family metallopeptidase [Apibacter muscae]|uniref:M23 family metallopeptidase n=1 Tax=Apibacter muscae TaxID=2509004 RepID=UPI0021A9FC2E|nr:M23 family metallopeptidase [Apibacter muscae]